MLLADFAREGFLQSDNGRHRPLGDFTGLLHKPAPGLHQAQTICKRQAAGSSQGGEFTER